MNLVRHRKCILGTSQFDLPSPIIAGLPPYSNEFLTKPFYISFIGLM
jgi:hypothetical protein